MIELTYGPSHFPLDHLICTRIHSAHGHRLGWASSACAEHPSNRWTALAIFLPGRDSPHRYCPARHGFHKPALSEHTRPYLGDHYPPGFMGWRVRRDDCLVANRQGAYPHLGHLAGSRPGINRVSVAIERKKPVEAMSLRDLPSVDELLRTPEAESYIASYGRPLVLSALRSSLEHARQLYPRQKFVLTTPELLQHTINLLTRWAAPSLFPVINATGVVLHTNLGRSPLSRNAIQAIQDVSLGYSNLEFDLQKGQRGSRLVHAEELLKQLTGAEAALVVNNNAAAVLLALTALARRRAVVIGRTQLVEIGGGFRVPEVMKQSGARLVEVGATNRVHLSDYASAIEESSPALLLRAHQSNFRIIGFTTEPSLAELIHLAHQHDLPLVDDLGSGVLLDTAQYGLSHEPTIIESVAAGADLVCFSGDKLLGGPQAGIIVGRADLVSKLKKHPLARAVRADKLCLAGLSATLLHYLKDEAETEIPIWRMIAAEPAGLRQRALDWAATLGHGDVIASRSAVGGGSLPEETLPTYVLALDVKAPNRFLEHLRQASPPVIARLEADRVLLDPRTVLPEQEPELLKVLQQAMK